MKCKYHQTILLVAFALTICTSENKLFAQPVSPHSIPMSKLETGFITVPDSIQTSVYWYWLNDNISKQGVINDLEAMKKVGINRAFIGNIGLDNVPYGKVKLFSEEWWEIMHTALKTATRLKIEIGIFNSPGWSQSGGPWVKPEQAMRFLTSSEIMVQGPTLFNQKLIKPDSVFQDVKIIAYPVAKDYNWDISALKPIWSSVPSVEDLYKLTDQNELTGVELKRAFTLNIESPKEYTARSLVIYPMHRTMQLEGDVQAKIKEVYTTIKHFKIDRTNSSLNVGFIPFAPAAISFPATTSKNFRIIFTTVSDNAGIAEVKLSSTPIVEQYAEKTLAKMWPTPLPYWTAYQWPVQPVVTGNEYVIDPGKVIDISKYMAADGALKWNVPAGNWIIERSGMTPTKVQNSPATPEGTGLETDKMSKEHIEAHFNAFLGQIIKRIPAEDRKTWKVTVEDSYETGGQNWTDQFIEKFKTNYGYDPTPYIPVMHGKVVGSEDQSDRFLWDVRRFIADNVAYQYVAGLRDISHKNGLRTWLECYGHWGFPGEFLQYGGQSDEVGGEFWSVGDLGNIENRAASSTAHIYGKTKVSAESFTGADPAFSRYPALMKQRADRFFTEGINNTLLHVSIEQAYEDKLPGVNAWFGNEFNRKNTWFYDMDIFLKYLKRCNLMLQQGKYVADVAYFISEDAPKMTGVQDPELPKGYSFDYINGEVIKTRMSVTNGKLALPDGMQYSILVLPKLETIRPELLLKIKELVIQGAVVLGPKPSKSPSMQNFGTADKQVQELANELWGKINGTTVKVNHYGKGMVIDGMNLQEALDMLKIIPDFKATPGDSILFIHRVLKKEGSVYFISNQKNSPVKMVTEFRVTGKIPELWDAVTGTKRDLLSYSQTPSTTKVTVELASLESAFIVFRKEGVAKNSNTKSNYPTIIKAVIINTPWSVNFDQKMRGPANPVIFNTLTNWAQNANDSIKYYSGTAYYYNTFNSIAIKKGEAVMLDLGAVNVIAKVSVNGINVGGAWIAPYKVDITKALKPGENELEIKVVNTWVNRLIGDSKLPVGDRKTWSFINPYNPKSGLLPSGLLGPVKLEVMKF